MGTRARGLASEDQQMNVPYRRDNRPVSHVERKLARLVHLRPRSPSCFVRIDLWLESDVECTWGMTQA